MAIVKYILKGLTAYPVPESTLLGIALKRGLDLEQEATGELLEGAVFNLAKADLYQWYSLAPNVSQGGQYYVFTEGQKEAMRAEARALYKAFGDEESLRAVITFGYKGSKL